MDLLNRLLGLTGSVSPKANADFVLKTGDELKIVFPQSKINPRNMKS